MQTILLLARHGQSDWNLERRWQGHADRPLTERGREQARLLAEKVAGLSLDALYASDLRRTRETAAAVAERVGLEVRVEPGLREVDVGTWSGLTREEARARFPEAFERWLRGERGWEGGETYEEMARRIVRVAAGIAEAHGGERVLLVTHAGPIRALHSTVLGLDIATYRRLRPVEPNARLSAICRANGSFTRLCAGPEIAELVVEEQAAAAAEQPPGPTPAG